MLKSYGIAALLGLALAAPAHEALAQDTLGGALFGGAAGAIVGGALGGGRRVGRPLRLLPAAPGRLLGPRRPALLLLSWQAFGH